MSAKRGTYRVTFEDGTVLITGNNYKWWYDHMVDYFYRVMRAKLEQIGRPYDLENLIKTVEYSGVPYVDDGGLKWCDPKSYEILIAEEGEKQHQTFTPLKDIHFEMSYADKARLKKEYKRL